MNSLEKILPRGPDIPAREYSPLTLAFLGDGIYEAFVRTKIVGAGNRPAGELHREAIHFVSATAQAAAMHHLSGQLSEEEIWIVKRGRNAKSYSVPKNADVIDYKMATGFEALIGYLYLMGEEDRLLSVMESAYAFLLNESRNSHGKAQNV